MITAECILKSKSSVSDSNIASVVCVYPRYIHSQMMTHKRLSRNSQSSRAIPFAKLKEMRFEAPTFYANQAGMQPAQILEHKAQVTAQDRWNRAADKAFKQAEKLAALGVHKQWVNRLVEPFTTITVLFTATQDGWDSFFDVRCKEDVQSETFDLADKIRTAIQTQAPQRSDLHLPFMSDLDRHGTTEDQMRVSAARCARVSYVNHHGVKDLYKDIMLSQRLLEDKHLSPFEHCAIAKSGRYANFLGWQNYRTQLGF